uniref:Uncharacterized protein n=1 Tax=Lepeophtheirus salmonis TaxID=72036 RepID=A0A0K2U4X3_LEPSM
MEGEEERKKNMEEMGVGTLHSLYGEFVPDANSYSYSDVIEGACLPRPREHWLHPHPPLLHPLTFDLPRRIDLVVEHLDVSLWFLRGGNQIQIHSLDVLNCWLSSNNQRRMKMLDP